jgi:hypothetical protein
MMIGRLVDGLFTRKRRRRRSNTPDKLISDERVQKWQSHVVTTILSGECTTDLPYNRNDHGSALLAFYIPPPRVIKASSLRALRCYWEAQDVECDTQVKWDTEKSLMVIFCRVCEFTSPARKSLRVDDCTQTIRYDPSVFAKGIALTDQERLHDVERRMLVVLGETGTLRQEDLEPTSSARDVVSHCFESPLWVSSARCRRKISADAIRRLVGVSHVSGAWVAWDAESKLLVLSLQLKDRA